LVLVLTGICLFLLKAFGEEGQGSEGPKQAQEASERVLRLHVSFIFCGVSLVYRRCFDFVLIRLGLDFAGRSSGRTTRRSTPM
jgi:hypothetical protein